MRAALDTDAGRALVADENHFIGDLRIVSIDQVEVILFRAATYTAYSDFLTPR